VQWPINKIYGNFNGNNKSGFNAIPNYFVNHYCDFTGYESDLKSIGFNCIEGAYTARFGMCSNEYFVLGEGYNSFTWGFNCNLYDNVGFMIRCVR
jgi:hypothetical protein